ncbi:unnamed protein product [Musa textilis]
MESVAASPAIPSSPCPLALFSPKRSVPRRPSFFPIASKNGEDEADLNSKSESASLVPFLSNRAAISPLPKDTAMGLALSAATGRGWTTGSGMEGPPVPADTDSADQAVPTFPWSLYTRSPRRRMRVVFTCNVCGQRTTRAINPTRTPMAPSSSSVAAAMCSINWLTI